MKIYLDDIRNPIVSDTDWVVIRTVDEFRDVVDENWNDIEVISLDHDMGEMQRFGGDGYDALLHLEHRVMNNGWPVIPVIQIHTSNPVGAQRMLMGASRISNRCYRV